jgi:galactokinase
MMTSVLSDRLMSIKESFFAHFRSAPVAIVRAPGRVNLIGEHTDYNEGFVLPVAIDRDMLVAASPATDETSKTVEIYSLDYKASDSFSMESIQSSADKAWSNYFRAVIKTMLDQGYTLPPFRAVLSGNVPQGAGLSSSAAYEVAVATILNELCNLSLTGKQIALIGQKAENDFVGVQCGIMDQFVSALGQDDSALFIDCRSLDFEAVPMALKENDCALVITNSGVRRGLVDSAYNERRQACQDGVKKLAKMLPAREVKSLRDIRWKEYMRLADKLPKGLSKRCRHVISENERVLKAVAALKKSNLKEFGRLMNASHDSLRRDYEVSCPEIDLLVGLTQSHSGVLGSRITGGGFGGCTVTLIKAKNIESYKSEIIPRYEQETERQAEVYVCLASAGAGLIRH